MTNDGCSEPAAPLDDHDHGWAHARIDKLALVYRLTRRETAIVAALVPGLSNKEIALRCGITEQTVKDHLKSVYAKVGVHQRMALLSRIVGFSKEA